jgi:predicted membrane chloride channel (bestrophin family)
MKIIITYSPLWRTVVFKKILPIIILIVVFPIGVLFVYEWICSKFEIEFKERGAL